jgi:glutamate/tyrosine decarboxylase-like PLP-dependent enzyme
LSEILKLRDLFSKKSLYFNVHCDGALGGYFRSVVQTPSEIALSKKVCVNSFSDYVAKQYEALSSVDSITFDPHKSGYNVIGSGAIIYRNHKMVNFINFSSSYILNHEN